MQCTFRNDESIFRHGGRRNESFLIFVFLCGFCLRDGREYLYVDDFFKDDILWSRSKQKGGAGAFKMFKI
jgi:hypothetical protein